MKKEIVPEQLEVILATDCGSTTSKARLFKKISNEYRFVESGEAPTTVEAPFEDVTMGVANAIREVEELTGHKLLSPEGSLIIPHRGDNEGVDLYVTTSSAGGGLQMMVTGVVKTMTAESANRAALGAGAIVMETLAVDDGYLPHERINIMRQLRPDMILMAGGTDGGQANQVILFAQMIAAAEPKHRLGTGFTLPIVYAGNQAIVKNIKDVLGINFSLRIVENLRPVLEVENIEPARESIHELFMEHVMAHAPGYDKLMKWTEVPILPTPAGEGMMFRLLAEERKVNLLGVGLGGATTNVYSVVDGRFVRSVSANLGMSYSICNVLKEAGIENIMRWVPFDVDSARVYDRLRNKMIRPTTIPHTIEDLVIEHAVAREALRLGLTHHKSLARGLLGIHKQMESIFNQKAEVVTYVDMMRIQFVVGTGGLLSRAPRRAQATLVLMDGFQLEGVTRMFQDSVFMIPHLGVLSTVHSKAALEIFEKDCLVRLGTCIAPKGQAERGEDVVAVTLEMPDGTTTTEKVQYGSIKVIPLKEGKMTNAEIKPSREFDVGAGKGHSLKTSVMGGVIGIIIDARGRPLMLPENAGERREKLMEWFTTMNAYPTEALKKYQRT